MLLSIKYNFLFVHVAKTGGTSVRSALQPLRWRDPWYYPMFVCSKLSGLTGHRIGAKFPRHAKVVAAREMLPEELFASLFKFAFVRNPWDLQVSSYHHIRRERPQLIERVRDFEQFIDWKLDPERPYQYHLDTSIESQLDYLVGLDGEMLVDFVGRYENLAEDFERVAHRIGAPGLSLPHRRRAAGRAKDYRDYYSDRTAALVADRFRRDIEAFEYRFDPGP